MPANALPLPDLRIRVNGTDVQPDLLQDVIAITTQEDLGAVGMFAIQLYNWNPNTLQYTWSDDNRFRPGAEVEISLGYVDEMQPILTGEVTSLEPAFESYETPQVTVRGFDRGHRLQRGRKTRSFVREKDSGIAQKVAREAGLTAKCTDSKITNEYVLQHNQSDWAFLTERADRIGYLLFVRHKELHFAPPALDRQPVVRFGLTDDVVSFHPRLASGPQVDQVLARGWHVKDKKAIVGTARSGQIVPIGSGASGLAQARSAFGAAEAAVVDDPVGSQAEADAMALAQLNDRARRFVTGELTCQGQPKVHPGDVVAVDGAGRRFSGNYFVTGVTHIVDMARGYQTRLYLQRSTA